MTIKIYKPSKTSMQSGFKKTKLWLAEYISEVEKVKDSLMGWNSSLDTKSQIKIFFDTKEQEHNAKNIVRRRKTKRGFALIFEIENKICALFVPLHITTDQDLTSSWPSAINQRPRPGGAGMQTAIAGDRSSEAGEKDH